MMAYNKENILIDKSESLELIELSDKTGPDVS